MEFRIVELLSNSTIVARSRSLVFDAFLICNRHKATCNLLPAKDLIHAKVLQPRRLRDDEVAA